MSQTPNPNGNPPADTFVIKVPLRHGRTVAVPVEPDSEPAQHMSTGSVWVVRAKEWDIVTRKHVILLERVDGQS